MADIHYRQPQGTFFSVLSSTGSFHTKVPEGTAGATKRSYETSDGKKGEKWELTAREISGKIDHISLYDGDFGTNILIHFELEENETEEDRVVVSLSVESRFGRLFLERLPHIKKGDRVTLKPYPAFDNVKSGISVHVNGEKVDNAYSKYEDGKWTLLDKNYPKLKDGASDSQKKIFFIEASEYKLNKLKEHELYSEESYEVPMAFNETNKYPTAESEGINVDDIAF